MKKIQMFVSRIEQRKIQRNNFFKNSYEEIAETNLYILETVSLMTIILLGFFLFITPFIFENWIVSTPYILLFPTMLCFFFGAFFYRKKEKKNAIFIKMLCLCYVATLFAFIIRFDVGGSPEGPSSFFGLLTVIVPILFIFRIREIYGLLLVEQIIFIFFVLNTKEGIIASSDTFNAIVSFVFSLVAGNVVMLLRIKDKSLRHKFEQLSTMDALTGVLNKISCENNIIEYLKNRDTTVKCGLMVMDIDDFKRINDEYGHQVGDDVLEEVGLILTQNFRSTDIIGRIGGDEFMVLTRNIPSAEVLEKKCLQLQAEMKKKINPMLQRDFSISIGVVVLAKEYISFEKAFRMADDALYEAKSFGKGRYILQVMQEEIRSAADKKVLIVADDYEADREIIKEIYEKDYHVVEAVDGTETLSVLSQYRDEIAAVILDIEMPGMNGYQVMKYIKERSIFSAIPVIVITADESYEERMLLLGAKDVLIKPIEIEVAKLRIQNAIKR